MDKLPDYGKPGRARRWLLMFISLALMLAVPLAVALIFGARIDGRMQTGAIMALSVMVALIGFICLVTFGMYRHSPAMQQQTAAVAAVMSGLFGTQMTLHLVSLIDAPAPSDIHWFGMQGSSAWFWLAGVPVGIGAGFLVWRLARPPAAPAATQAPPAGAITYRLAPRQKALFTATRWLSTNLITGGVMVLAGGLLIARSFTAGQFLVAGLALLLLGGWTLAQAHAGLIVDDKGVTFVAGGIMRTMIPFEHVRQADALAASPPAKYFQPAGSARGFGAATGKGPAFGLRLTDGRHFVFSTPEAETVAGLVNGYLHRARADADHG